MEVTLEVVITIFFAVVVVLTGGGFWVGFYVHARKSLSSRMSKAEQAVERIINEGLPEVAKAAKGDDAVIHERVTSQRTDITQLQGDFREINAKLDGIKEGMDAMSEKGTAEHKRLEDRLNRVENKLDAKG